MNTVDTKRIDTTRIDKCLFQALAGNQQPGEVTAAIRAADTLTKKMLGISVADYFRSVVVRSPSNDDDLGRLSAGSADVMRTAALEAERDRLKSQVSSLSEQVGLLKTENDLLSRHRDAPAPEEVVITDGKVSWDDFYRVLISHMGTTKRALTNYCDLTGVTQGKVQTWRKLGSVPEASYQSIFSLNRDDAPPSVRQTLSDEQMARIDALTGTGLTDNDIANTMAAEFPERSFNVNMIKGAKTQIRAAFIGSLLRDRRTREEARSIILERYPKIRKVDAILDRVFG